MRTSLNPADILAAIIVEERISPRFDPREPRVSAIGLCQRKQVFATFHPDKMPPFPWLYQESGHALQHRAFLRFKRRYPDAEEEVSVPHPWGTCHPDIWIPSERMAIQVKTGTQAGVVGKDLKPSHRDQVLLEWALWREAGGCDAEDGVYVDGVPESYWVLLLSRDDWGGTTAANRVKWNGPRAEHLRARLGQIAAWIEAGIVPERDLTAPNFECNDRVTGEVLCPCRKECWS